MTVMKMLDGGLHRELTAEAGVEEQHDLMTAPVNVMPLTSAKHLTGSVNKIPAVVEIVETSSDGVPVVPNVSLTVC